MKYAVLFEDNDDFAHMRPKYMADHLRFLADNSERIDAAGPLKDSESGQPAGGVWIVEADDAGRCRRWSKPILFIQPVCARRFVFSSGRRSLPMASS